MASVTRTAGNSNARKAFAKGAKAGAFAAVTVCVVALGFMLRKDPDANRSQKARMHAEAVMPENDEGKNARLPGKMLR